MPTPRPTDGTFGRALVLSTVGSGVVLLLSLANNVALARLAGPEGRGVYALAMSVLYVAWPVLTVGTPVAAVYYLGGRIRPVSVRGFGLLVVGAWTIALGVAGVVVGASGKAHFGIPPAGWTLILLTAPAVAYVEFSRATWLGLGCIRPYVMAQIGTLALVVAANVAFVTAAPLRVLEILAVTWWTAAVVQGVLHIRDGIAWPRSFEARLLLRFGLRAVVTRLANLGFSRADYLVLPWLVSMADVGVYAVADQTVTALVALALAAGQVLQSDAARNGGDTEGARRLADTCRLVVALGVAVAAAGMATFWWVLPAVFGPRFADAYPLFLLLLPVLVLRSISSLLGPYLEGLGAQRPVIVGSAVAFATTFLLVFPLVSWLGVAGAAVAKTGAALAQWFVLWRAAPKEARHAGMLRLRTTDLRRVRELIHRRRPGAPVEPLPP